MLIPPVNRWKSHATRRNLFNCEPSDARVRFYGKGQITWILFSKSTRDSACICIAAATRLKKERMGRSVRVETTIGKFDKYSSTEVFGQSFDPEFQLNSLDRIRV